MNIQIIINALDDPVAVVDQNGDIIHVNQVWRQFCLDNDGDLSKTDIGVNYLNVLPPTSDIYAGIQDVLSGRKASYSYSYPCPSPTEERWYVAKVAPLMEEATIIGALIQHVNITFTERLRVEVQDVLESMTDAFFSLDENWCFTSLNREAEKVLNTSKEHLLGKNVWAMFPEAVGTKFELHYYKTMKENETTRFEEFYAPLQTWFEVHAYPRNSGGISVFFKNINAKKELDQKLWYSAYHDHLTSLPNRRHVYEEITTFISQGVPFSMFFLDLDQFKMVNDIHGHAAGDLLLIEVANRLRSHIEQDHLIARLGGDEFIIILKGHYDDELLRKFGQYVLKIFTPPFNLGKLPELLITPSVGVSQYPEDGSTVDVVMSKADTAMYEAKTTKINKVIRYDTIMHDRISRRLNIQMDLKKAVEKGEYYFVLQPQIHALSRHVVAFEVLSRWHHPTLGLIPPSEFIPVAEEIGMIESLTEYMIEEMLKHFKMWRRIYPFEGKLSVNISSLLLSQESFITFLIDRLCHYEIPGSYLEIEITESIQLLTSPEIIEHLTQLRRHGLRVAIDDFGTGYSTLSYLSHFPIDKVKIDKYFINQIGQDEKAEAILQAIIKLAQNLKLDLVAEGVENSSQHNYLLQHDCYYMQGYYYYRPMPIDECERLLK